MTPAARRADRRKSKAALAKAAREASAARQEDIDEAIAPAAQRKGTATRGPRVIRDGNTFRVGWYALGVLLAASDRRAKQGKAATITQDHAKAASRLVVCARECETISAGVSSYGDRIGGAIDSGMLSRGAIDRINRQIEAHKTMRAAQVALGGNWDIVAHVVVSNRDIRSWSDRTGIEPQAAVGVLRGALTALVDFWRCIDE